MSASRRPPGARRSLRTSGHRAPADPGRSDTTPLEIPRPATRPLPVQRPAAGHAAPQDAAPVPAPRPGHGGPGDGGPGDGSPGDGSPGPARLTVTRVAVARSRELTAAGVRRVRTASRADGAGESGLTSLLWVNALHMAGDAMVAVSLAGTLFFAATTDARRSNVALYLLVTMAPFALLAPVIGPALDRLQRGRRWALAASLLGRAALALVMVAHHDDAWLYPAALGVLVLSKSHNVLRAAVVPRVLPPTMSLTSANARLSVFGMVTAGIAGGLGAGVAALLGFGSTLIAAAAVFVTAGVLAVRLPRHVDVPTGEVPADVLTTAELPVTGRRRRVSPRVVLALRAVAALRGLGGFLTIFTAFLVQATFGTGWDATLALGAVAAAAGLGSLTGTAAGSRPHRSTPDGLVLIAAAAAAAVTVLAALFYSFAMAAVVAFVAAVTNALGKVSLDAIIQRDVPDGLRASAFARSETLLQLAWVAGGALGIALPPTGWLGFTAAAALLVLAVGLVSWGRHRGRPRPDAAAEAPTTPVGPPWS